MFPGDTSIDSTYHAILNFDVTSAAIVSSDTNKRLSLILLLAELCNIASHARCVIPYSLLVCLYSLQG